MRTVWKNGLAAAFSGSSIGSKCMLADDANNFKNYCHVSTTSL
jgi:hypothetical protein